MTSFAWVIDQTSCIGCHACTTACTSENEVPLGVDRTWVKYIETGTFPQTRRQIAVLRCNHCALARPGPARGPAGSAAPSGCSTRSAAWRPPTASRTTHSLG